MKELIKKLTEAFGTSGSEENIRAIIEKEIRPFISDIRVDKLGNLIAKKGKKGGAKLMLGAHMDEIGIVVTHIDEKGFLRFSNVGGVNPLKILGHRVIFANGTVGTFGEEKRESIKDEPRIDKMYIDIGARDKESARKNVKIGDVASYHREFVDLGNRLLAKAFDDRIGCAILIEVIKSMKHTPNETYFVFTTQEEVGCRGARTSAYSITPDVAIAVDVTTTGDTPEASTMAVELGKGPAIKVMDTGLLAHPKIKNLLISISQKKKIPYQLEVLRLGTTDASTIQFTKEGVPSGTVSIPTRYVHTPSEMVDMDDVNNTVKLLCAFVSCNLRLEGF
jgi:endoglucanase